MKTNFKKVYLPDGSPQAGYFLIKSGKFKNFVIEISNIKLSKNKKSINFGWNLHRVPSELDDEYVNSIRPELEKYAESMFQSILDIAIKQTETRK